MPRVIPLLVVAGPTACGKTQAAIRVARAVGGEIISADSMQIYRGLEVGTAKPTPEERAQARFHLVDFVDVEQPYTVADFQRDATQAIAEVWGRGCLPILCGGTGLYVRAVLEHFVFPADDPQQRARLRTQLEAEAKRLGTETMHRRLSEIDPEAAVRIMPGDLRRILRALEVCALTGAPAGVQQRRVDDAPGVQYNHSTFILSRPRAVLYEGIEQRVDQMMAAGWVDEAAALRRSRPSAGGSQAMQAIGYRHLWQALEERPENLDLDGLTATIKRDTRRFAKRQLTWFRRESPAQWREWGTAAEFDCLLHDLCHGAARLLGERREGIRK
ncbi:tRNA (adenosine(37)-N6)-dimethylallyltransferase MiaA [bacterium]|nr:tRNA (adenosine(37)-N6)-dimethylallyltransferase MiaA [bacterium]